MLDDNRDLYKHENIIQLLRLLTSSRRTNREVAQKKLQNYNKDNLFTFLVELVKAKDKFKELSVWGMPMIEPEKGVALLVELLQLDDGQVKYYICQVLSNYPGKEVELALREQAVSSLVDVRGVAVHALGRVGSEAIISILESIRQNDKGITFHGHYISDIASVAIESIDARQRK